MRTIKISQRAARLLRENLTTSQEGYEYVDLLRLDALAKELTVLQGDYAVRMAELVREERAIRRQLVKTPADTETANRALLSIQYEAEDLNEAADAVMAEVKVTEADYRLIRDKLDNVARWTANDAIRPTILAMCEAVHNAESDEPESPAAMRPRALRR